MKEDIPDSLGGLTTFWFFGLRDHNVGGTWMTLRSYENDIIRPLGDPRVHFALNCMSVGCPVLPRVAFEASTLDATLEQEARKFLAEDRNVHIDAQHKTVA